MLLRYRDVRLGELEMLNRKQDEKRPLAYCVPCSERTPHRYERIGLDGRLASRAICLVCNNDSRNEAVQHGSSLK